MRRSQGKAASPAKCRAPLVVAQPVMGVGLVKLDARVLTVEDFTD